MIAAASALPAQPAPSATPTPLVRSPGNADWAVSLAEARQRASGQQKFIFVEFDRQGCGNCQRMDQLLYPAFDFEALLVPMVPIKVDLDSPEGQALGLRYEIDEAPSVLVVTPEGRLAFLMQGFQNAPDFYRHIHEQLDAYRRFARKIDAQDVAKLPAPEALSSGRELSQRHDPAAALPRLERVGRAPGGTDAMREEALELAASAELELGNPAAAQRTIQKLISSTKDPARQERAELFRAQIPLSANNPAEALKLLQDFRKAYPQSAYAAQVDAIIQKLQEARPR
ncbi:MAG TPA: hypothetical protein VMR54_10675 [Thermoanaerobaculia bacterium]|nr:hypothetical protein [Thermoanaerobaculia bacterium]